MDFKSIFDDDVRKEVDDNHMQVNHALAFTIIRRLNGITALLSKTPTESPKPVTVTVREFDIAARKGHKKSNRPTR